MKRIKVLHLGYSDSEGGAARAAARIHNSMLQGENSFPIDSKSYVVRKNSETANTFGEDSVENAQCESGCGT